MFKDALENIAAYGNFTVGLFALGTVQVAFAILARCGLYSSPVISNVQCLPPAKQQYN